MRVEGLLLYKRKHRGVRLTCGIDAASGTCGPMDNPWLDPVIQKALYSDEIFFRREGFFSQASLSRTLQSSSLNSS